MAINMNEYMECTIEDARNEMARTLKLYKRDAQDLINSLQYAVNGLEKLIGMSDTDPNALLEGDIFMDRRTQDASGLDEARVAFRNAKKMVMTLDSINRRLLV